MPSSEIFASKNPKVEIATHSPPKILPLDRILTFQLTLQRFLKMLDKIQRTDRASHIIVVVIIIVVAEWVTDFEVNTIPLALMVFSYFEESTPVQKEAFGPKI